MIDKTNIEFFLLNSEEIYKEEKWSKKHLKTLLILDWKDVRKRLKKKYKNIKRYN